MCKIFNLWLKGRTFKHEILLFEYTTPYVWGGGGGRVNWSRKRNASICNYLHLDSSNEVDVKAFKKKIKSSQVCFSL